MNLLSVYLAPGHQRPGDLDYIRRLQPSVCRILEPDVNDIANVHAASPGTLIMPRYWWLDDGNRQQYIAMMNDPVGTGKRHAAEWARELSRLHREASERGLTIPRMPVTGVNEPNTNESEGQTVEYNRVFLSELAEQGIQGGALCLSVGHPTRLKPGKVIDWDAYMPLERVIQQGKHYVVLHEYWQEEGPFHGDDWGFLAGRHKQCPFNAPIIIGEAGVDGGIYNRHGRNVGWHALLKGDAGKYAAQVSAYCNAADPRVIGVCLFLTDYRDNHWASFDTEAAHGRLLEAAEQIRQVGPPQWGGGMSTDGNAKIMYVNSPDGLNVRGGPGTQYTRVRGLTHGTQVNVYEVNAENWARIDGGWVAAWLLTDSQPSAPPVVVAPGPVEPVPVGNVDQRVLQAILNVESGGNAAGPDGRVIIRFENHVFLQRHAAHELFRHGNPSWTKHEWRRNPHEAWRPVHTGAQSSEWEVYEFAASLNREAASESISMGAPQIMGFHYPKFGYASATGMLQAFRNPQTQIVAFFVFLLNTRGLLAAIQQKNWREIARLYNGAGNVESASAKYEAAYRQLGG